jgi:hypothetical protein
MGTAFRDAGDRHAKGTAVRPAVSERVPVLLMGFGLPTHDPDPATTGS